MLLAGVADGHERVGRLAGLGDGDHQRHRVDDRVAVAELGGQLHLTRDAGPVFDRVLGHQPGVERRATGDDDDLVDPAQFLGADAQLVEDQLAAFVEAAEQGVGHGGGLLEDLLAHEPVVTVLLGGGQIPIDVEVLGLGGRPVEGGDVDAVAGQFDDLVLPELHGVARVGDERGDIGGEEVLVLPDANHQRGASTGRDDPVGVLESTATRVNAPRLPTTAPAPEQVSPAVEFLAQQVGGDLGVGL